MKPAAAGKRKRLKFRKFTKVSAQQAGTCRFPGMRGTMRLDISVPIPPRPRGQPSILNSQAWLAPRTLGRVASHRGRGKLDNPELSTKPVSTDSLERVPFLRTFGVSKVIVGTEISGLAPAQPPLVRSLVVGSGPSTSQE